MPTISGVKTKRLNIEIREDYHAIFKKHLEYGMMKHCFDIIFEDMVEMLETYGQHFVVAIMQRRVSYKGMMNRYVEANKEIISAVEQMKQADLTDKFIKDATNGNTRESINPQNNPDAT